MRRKSTTVVGGHRIIGGHRPWRDADFMPALSARLARRASTSDGLDVANLPAPDIRVGRNLGQWSESSYAIEDAAPIPPIPESPIARVELLQQARDAATEFLGQPSEAGHAAGQLSEPTVRLKRTRPSDYLIDKLRNSQLHSVKPLSVSVGWPLELVRESVFYDINLSLPPSLAPHNAREPSLGITEGAPTILWF
jgi:hypothetical protein